MKGGGTDLVYWRRWDGRIVIFFMAGQANGQKQAGYSSQGYISRGAPMHFSYFMQVNGLYAYKFCHGISFRVRLGWGYTKDRFFFTFYLVE